MNLWPEFNGVVSFTDRKGFQFLSDRDVEVGVGVGEDTGIGVDVK